MEARASPPGRYAGRRTVLRAGGGAFPLWRRPGAGNPFPPCPWRLAGRSAAGCAFAFGPAIRGGGRGWLARSIAAFRPAARGAGGRQGAGPLADHGRAADCGDPYRGGDAEPASGSLGRGDGGPGVGDRAFVAAGHFGRGADAGRQAGRRAAALACFAARDSGGDFRRGGD